MADVRSNWTDRLGSLNVRQWFSSALDNRAGAASVLLFLLNGLFIFPVFFPNLNEIICFDEAGYVNLGRRLYEGHLPNYAANPLIALLYLPGYVAVRGSAFWLLHSLTIGRFVLFGLLWLGAYQVARQLLPRAHPYVVAGLLFVSPVLKTLLANPSDALFASMSALALWQFLVFYHRRELRYLRTASTLVGLAALARNDGLILFVMFVLATLLLRPPRRRMVATLLNAALPFLLLMGGYLLLYRGVVGQFELGTGERMYTAFEQGQGVAYRELYGEASPFAQGQVEARRLYGTPEENNYSVLSAIRRNPGAFLRRVGQVVEGLPWQAVSVYGLGIGAVLFLFAARGGAHLIANREWTLLGIMLLWCAPLLVYLVTFFRPGYLLLPFSVVFSLAGIGATAMLSKIAPPFVSPAGGAEGEEAKGRHLLRGRHELVIWSLAFSALAVYALVKRQPDLFVAATAFLMGLWLAWTLVRRESVAEGTGLKPASTWVPFVLMLCVALAMAGGFTRPEFRTLGVAPDERGALFMRDHLPRGSNVAAFAPCAVWLADMANVPINFELRSKATAQELLDWLTNRDVKAIYVDDRLRNNEPETLARIEGLIGNGIEVGFQRGSVQVLLVHESP